jgi:hypothetical protein
MKIYYLHRQLPSFDATFGEFFDDANTHLCFTVERPWLNNKPLVSCIPVGRYRCIPHNSKDHPNTWEITNVQNRTNVLIHNANFAHQLLGCVGVGKKIDLINGIKGVTQSVDTLNYLRKVLPNEFDLVITQQ